MVDLCIFEKNIVLGGTIPTRDDFEDLKTEHNIDAVLSLEGEKIDPITDIESYLWITMLDRSVPNDFELTSAMSFLDSCQLHNRRVYIHCHWGHGRAPTILISYLITRRLLSFEDALQKVYEIRPMLNLSLEQERFLKELARKTGEQSYEG